MGVETRRDEDPRRAEIGHYRRDDLVQRIKHDVARGAGGKRDIQGQPRRVGPSSGRCVTGARVKGRLVGRDIKDPGLVPKDVLRAVAVVHVPVQDEYALALGQQGGCRHRHIVENAKTHRPVGRGVMAGRPVSHEGVAATGGRQRLHRRQGTASRQQRRIPRSRADHRVLVERATPGGAKILQETQVLLLVGFFQLFIGGSPGRELDDGFIQPRFPIPASAAFMRSGRSQ